MVRGLAERLTKLRMHRKLSQRQVAERLGLSASVISGYETGEKTPSVEQLLALSRLYSCSTDYLLGKQKEVYVTKNRVNRLSDEQSELLSSFINAIKNG